MTYEQLATGNLADVVHTANTNRFEKSHRQDLIPDYKNVRYPLITPNGYEFGVVINGKPIIYADLVEAPLPKTIELVVGD